MAHHDVGHVNSANKVDDGADANEGGGQDHIRNPHPPKAGGEKHGGVIALAAETTALANPSN